MGELEHRYPRYQPEPEQWKIVQGVAETILARGSVVGNKRQRVWRAGGELGLHFLLERDAQDVMQPGTRYTLRWGTNLDNFAKSGTYVFTQERGIVMKGGELAFSGEVLIDANDADATEQLHEKMLFNYLDTEPQVTGTETSLDTA